MDNCLEFIYNYLIKIDKFTLNDYKYLISIFGDIEVNNTIDIILQRESFKESLFYDKLINCYDDDNKVYEYVNVILTGRVRKIILLLEEIFNEFEEDKISIKGKFLADRVNFCLEKCSSIEKLNMIKSLYKEFILLRDKIVEVNMGLVNKIASKYFTNSSQDDDNYQWGYFGLLRSIELYDVTKNISFSTYACSYINGWILKNRNRLNFIVTVPQKKRNDYDRIQKYINTYYDKFGINPSISDVSKNLDMSLSDVSELMTLYSGYYSFDRMYTTIDTDECFNLLDVLSDDYNIRGIEESCFSDDMSKDVADALSTLSSIELKVLEYKILSERKYSFNEIARILGISRYMVEKNYRTALVRLKNHHKELKSYL